MPHAQAQTKLSMKNLSEKSQAHTKKYEEEDEPEFSTSNLGNPT